MSKRCAHLGGVMVGPNLSMCTICSLIGPFEEDEEMARESFFRLSLRRKEKVEREEEASYGKYKSHWMKMVPIEIEVPID